MASKQLVNGEDEDPYKSEGRIEMKIENLTGFIHQGEDEDEANFSEPVYVRGMPWIISVYPCDHHQPEAAAAQNGQKQKKGKKQKCLGYYLNCDAGTGPFWSCSVTSELKVLAQKEGSADHVFTIDTFDYHANHSDRDFLGDITFEEIMDPNNGWYDKQSDSIVLAVDLTVNTAEGGVGKYVVVAEEELKLDNVPINFPMQIGHLEWEIKFDYYEETRLVELSCKDVAKKARGVDKVLMELFAFQRDDPNSELYSPIPEEEHRHLFTREDNSILVNIPEGCTLDNVMFTIRVFKECSQFPDFTKPTAKVGCNAANVKLRVGDQQFHVNKQLLSALSPFFNRMFYGDSPDADQEEVELGLIAHTPELFHHFLLVMCIDEALPNSMNVAALFKLADFYKAGNVREKCDRHIRTAREMPIEKRVLLACQYGSKETRTLITDIVNSPIVNLEQSKRVNRLLMEYIARNTDQKNTC